MEFVLIWMVVYTDCAGNFKGPQSRQFTPVPLDHVWSMRIKCRVEDQRNVYKDYKPHLPRADGFTTLHYRNDLPTTL